MKLRIIPFQKETAEMNMAYDEAIMHEIREGNAPPTLRIYGWKPSAVSIGYFQSLEREVNRAECEKQDITLIRRKTGGGAVYHDTEGEITFSFIGLEELFPKNIKESYQFISTLVIDALATLGISVEHAGINDLILDGKKVSGSAQTRKEGVFLQHGTLLFKVDPEKMFSLLTVSQEKIADKFISSVKKRVTSLSEHQEKPLEEFAQQLEAYFLTQDDSYKGSYSEKEIELAKEFAPKYSSEEWISLR